MLHDLTGARLPPPPSSIDTVGHSANEVVKKLSEGHHFLETVLKSEKIFLQGDERELAATLGK